jgi:hypothetical protein
MRAARITGITAGVVLALLGLGVVVGVGGILLADARDGALDGRLTSPAYEVDVDSHALVTEPFVLEGTALTERGWPDWVGGDLRFTARARDGGPIFIGIGPASEVDRYLLGVQHDQVTWFGPFSTSVRTEETQGTRAPTPPAEAGFWTASAAGEGQQTVRWTGADGTWSVMVADPAGAAGVDAEVGAAFRARALLPVLLGLVLTGVLLLLGGTALLAVSAVRAPAPEAGGAPPTTQPAATRGAHPLRLEARLDEPLSPWLWLVKWLLLLPHLVVLAFLWAAFVVLTVVAGGAILATGRYPRGLFDFNVGVLRWTWRVGYYSYAALGTDRYPPFALDATGYPATLEVAYPERLSRGLVLVKWWLLAIPHYLVLALLVGGGLRWTFGDDAGGWTLGGGLLGVLVLIAGVILLIGRRYPAGLYDVVLGLNRWAYRVVAYAALLTDVYPPFRLDLGGSEGGPPTPPPPAAPGGDLHVDDLQRA